MKKLYFLLLFGVLHITLPAQDVLPNHNFYVHDTITCPFDPTIQVVVPRAWEIYQTLDGKWNGPVDSSRCFSIKKIAQPFPIQFRLDLDQADLSRPIFVRARLEDYPKIPLLENALHLIGSYFSVSKGVKWKVGSDCPDEVCTGIITGVAIPDSTFTDPTAATRIQTALASPMGQIHPSGKFYGEAMACVATEYFPGTQFLRDFVMKFTLEADSQANPRFMEISEAYWSLHHPFPDLLHYVTAQPQHFQNGVFEVPLHETTLQINFSQNVLAPYLQPTYPSPTAQSYIEGAPDPNTSDPQKIELHVDSWQSLVFQPFTQLRGGFAEGSDSIRHTLTLVNNGGNLCLNFVDLIFTDRNSYVHNGGSIDVHNAYSCMQFRKGSTLTVGKNQTLHYGKEGTGMLQLCAGGSIVFEKNAELIIDAILNLSECDDNLPSQQIYVDLPSGNHLRFTEHARLFNRFSKDQKMMLNVRMLGGTLDDELLPPSDRAIIRRVYPQPSPQLGDNVELAPNPFHENLTLRYNAAEQETAWIKIFDTTGRLVFSKKMDFQKGINETVVTMLQSLHAGFYYFFFEKDGQSVVKKVIKFDGQ